MRQKSGAKRDIVRPFLPANNINGGFNCVSHRRLTDILARFRFPQKLVNIISDFNTDRTISWLSTGNRRTSPMSSSITARLSAVANTVHHICCRTQHLEVNIKATRNNLLR